ncbi:hypothetical protein BBP40_005517 [Aspergillus hancockii]|nr:hypothetical protein BBP40_005517 [Aspergillus hancockii]
MAPIQSRTASTQPVVVGLYAIPGAGKTFLLNQLKEALGENDFMYFEGSEVIGNLVVGGLSAFKNLNDQDQKYFREEATRSIQNECMAHDKTGIVTGHFLFWDEDKECVNVCTQSDLDSYTHILYLDVPPETIMERRWNDVSKGRDEVSLDHVKRWQQAEKKALRDACQLHDILFCAVSPRFMPFGVEKLLLDFNQHHVRYNLLGSLDALDSVVFNGHGQLRKMVVFDADRTLNAEDTGALFWEKAFKSREHVHEGSSKTPAQLIFGGPMGYSYNAFRQVTLLHEEVLDDDEYESVCKDVASSVTIHPEIVTFLQRIAEETHVGAVVVTCGLAQIWKHVLEKEGLLGKINVIGGGRINDGFVVTADVKESIVTSLQHDHRMAVWAFGDSPLDLKMLCKADRAVVVVGMEETRSKTMDAALMKALETKDLKAYQCRLPYNASRRLTREMLPEIKLTGPLFIDALLSGRVVPLSFQVTNAYTSNQSTAKILMTPMRDARFQGPTLREAHRRVGAYLSAHFIPEIVGIEEYMIPHTQGNDTTGHRLLHEKETLIVALMRGGEPMAFGVNDSFPSAMFLHAKEPDDIKRGHLDEIVTIVLVDSVINSGKTILRFIEHIRRTHATVRIIVITGVLQAQCVSGGKVVQELASHIGVHLITLRISENKYKGTGGIDTGNRLFNTVHMA